MKTYGALKQEFEQAKEIKRKSAESQMHRTLSSHISLELNRTNHEHRN